MPEGEVHEISMGCGNCCKDGCMPAPGTGGGGGGGKGGGGNGALILSFAAVMLVVVVAVEDLLSVDTIGVAAVTLVFCRGTEDEVTKETGISGVDVD